MSTLDLHTLNQKIIALSSNNTLPIGSMIFFDANTPTTIDGITVEESVKAGEWTDNVTIPGWYACVAGNQNKGCQNLVDRFIMGKDLSFEGGVGGANAKTLAKTNIPSHNHSATHSHSAPSTGGRSAYHQHDAKHSHTASSNSVKGGDALYNTGSYDKKADAGGSSGYYMVRSYNHSHTITVNENDFDTGDDDTGHTHSVSVDSKTLTTGSTGGGDAFDNRPAFYTAIYIRKCA